MDHDRPRSTDRALVRSGLLFGGGVAAALVDLLVFHLLLQWHHFYDRSTPYVSLVSDGVLHAVAWAATVAGVFGLVEIRRTSAVDWRRWAAAVVTGVGAFQLFDGIVDHQILRVHQVRYDVPVLPYDVAWVGSAVVLLVVGLVALRRTRPARDAAGR